MCWRFHSLSAAQTPRMDSALGTRAHQLGGGGGNWETDLGEQRIFLDLPSPLCLPLSAPCGCQPALPNAQNKPSPSCLTPFIGALSALPGDYIQASSVLFPRSSLSAFLSRSSLLGSISPRELQTLCFDNLNPRPACTHSSGLCSHLLMACPHTYPSLLSLFHLDNSSYP